MRNKGFTLIEILVVIAFIVIVSAIVFPKFVGYTEAAKDQVCNSNCKTIKGAYNEYLEIEKLEHSEAIFNQYIIDNGYYIIEIKHRLLLNFKATGGRINEKLDRSYSPFYCICPGFTCGWFFYTGI